MKDYVMASKPKGIRREGAQLLYGNILIATLHEEINLTAEQKELERFIKTYRAPK